MQTATWIGAKPPPLADRPRCPGCNKPLQPVVDTRHERRAFEGGGVGYVPVSREWSGDFDGYGAFCTLRCAAKFANAAYRAGYRLKSAG